MGKLMKKKQKIDYKKWLKHRERTTNIFFFINIAIGVEYSLTFSTLFVYLKDFLKLTTHLNAFYSSISGIYILSNIVASIVVGKIFDKTRQLRLILCVITALTSLGNVLYTIPISPWMLFVGRLLSGIGGSMRPVIVSELIRSHPPDEVIPQMAGVACTGVFGYTIGPCINFAFVRADFWFLGVHIKYANGASLVACFIFVATFFASFFFVSDLSREFDMKEAIGNLSEEDLKNASLSLEEHDSADGESPDKKGIDLGKSQQETTQLLNEHSSQEPNTLYALKNLFINFHTLMIFAISYAMQYAIVTYDLWVPLVCIELLHWGNLEINIIYLGNGLVALLGLVLLVFKSFKQHQLYKLTFAAFIAVIYIFGTFLFFKLDTRHTVWLDALLWLISCFCGSIVFAVEELFLISTLAKMVPSRYQALSEGVRLAFSRSGAALGLFSATFTFQHLIYICPFIFAFVLLLTFLVIVRRNRFLNPVPIF